jgi:hypothetical protein
MTGEKLVILDEQDPTFLKIRHIYLGEIGELISELVADDAGLSVVTTKSSEVSLSDLRKGLLGLSESQNVYHNF